MQVFAVLCALGDKGKEVKGEPGEKGDKGMSSLPKVYTMT